MKVIDIHTHVFPDHLAEKTIQYLEEEADTKAFLNGTVSDLKHSMRLAGINISVNQPIATKPSHVTTINNWAIGIQDNAVISFGTIHPLYEAFKEEICRISKLGLKGIKFHPDYQKFHPDDVSVFPLYECLIAYDMIILFHAGIDIGLYPPVYATPQRLANVLEAFPKMKMIAAHMGGYNLWNDVEEYLIGREVFFDTSYVIDYIHPDQLLRLIKAHGPHRVLFGTDSPWKPQTDEVRKVDALPLSNDEKEAIFYNNATRLLSI